MKKPGARLAGLPTGNRRGFVMDIERARRNHKHEPGCGCPFDPMWQVEQAADPGYWAWAESLPTEFPEPEDFEDERRNLDSVA